MGAKAYVGVHERELKKIIAIVNLDGLDSTELTVPEIQLSHDLAGRIHEIIDTLLLNVPRWFILPVSENEKVQMGAGSSDHEVFTEKGVSCVFISSCLDPRYHTAMDRPENINCQKLKRSIRIAEAIVLDLARIS